MTRNTTALVTALAVGLGASSASAQTIFIPRAPPPLQAETPPPAPLPGGEWTPGYWFWNGSTHVWIPGRWQARPQAACRWVPSRWAPRQGRWQFVQGGWRCGRRMQYAPPPVIPPNVAQPVPVYPQPAPQPVYPQPVYPQPGYPPPAQPAQPVYPGGVQQGVPAYHAPSGQNVQPAPTVVVPVQPGPPGPPPGRGWRGNRWR